MVNGMKISGNNGKIFVNKLAAADRNLNASIRMYFLEEDIFATHIIASASLNVFADILSHREKDFTKTGLQLGIFYMAKDYLDGKLSKNDMDQMGADIFDTVVLYSEELKRNPGFAPEEILIQGTSRFDKYFWGNIRKMYNFLKHANRDPLEIGDEALIDNERIIYYSMFCSHLLKFSLSKEKEIFMSMLYAKKKLDFCMSDNDLYWGFAICNHNEIMKIARTILYDGRLSDSIDLDIESIIRAGRKEKEGYIEKNNL